MNELTFKTICRELSALAFPMALTQFIAIGSGFIAMAMLGQLGPDVLAASALIISARLSTYIVGSSILFSLSVIISHAYGEQNFIRIGNFMQQGWTLAFCISAPIMLIVLNLHTILLYFGQSPAFTEIIRQFFHANVWQILPFMLAICNQQLCYGVRKQKIDLFANSMATLIGIGSAYLLIFGHLGFPKLGVAGLGYAWDLQGLSYFLITFGVIYWNDFFKKFSLFTYRVHKNFSDFIYMLKIGWPICMQMGGEIFAILVFAMMVGWLGVKPLAAYQVVTQYFYLVIVPLFAFSQASGVLVGQAFGAKNYDKIIQIGRAALLLAFSLTLLTAAIFLLFPKQLSALYIKINDPAHHDIMHIIIFLFALFALQQMFDGIRNVLTGLLRGLFDTRFPMMIGILVIWGIGIPLGYFFAFRLHWGVYGMTVGSILGFFTGMIILLCRWKKIIYKLK